MEESTAAKWVKLNKVCRSCKTDAQRIVARRYLRLAARAGLVRSYGELFDLDALIPYGMEVVEEAATFSEDAWNRLGGTVTDIRRVRDERGH